MGDRLALVGRPGGRRGAIQRKRQVGACESAKSEVGGNLASVIKPGLGAAAVVPERRRRHANLVGQVVQQRFGHRLAGAQAEAGVAQQAELHGEAKAVVGAVPVRRKLQVGRGQGVMADELGLALRQAKEAPALVVVEQVPPRHARRLRLERQSLGWRHQSAESGSEVCHTIMGAGSIAGL